MKKYLKHIILAITILSVFLLAGCAEININASISNENLVIYTYTLNFNELDEDNPNTKSLETLLIETNSYWQDLGFDSELTSEGDTTTLVCTMQKQCATREEAFQALYEFMTNEITLFDDVSYTYINGFYKEDYSIVSHLDLSKIIDEEIYEVYPKIVGENVDDFAQSINCTVTFSLPVNESTETDALSQSQTVTAVGFSEPAEINISGYINNNENMRYENSLLEEKSKTMKALIIFGGASLLAVILAVILLIFRKKMLKSNKQEDKEENVELMDKE